jgi:hypothetical protein
MTITQTKEEQMKKAKAAPMIQAEYARYTGKPRQIISRYVKAGMPTEADGRIDPAKADKWIEDSIDSRTSPSETLIEARTRDASAAASLKEIELQKRRGELVSGADLVRQLQNAFLAARNRWLQSIGKISSRLNLNPEQSQIVKDEIFATLQYLSESSFMEEKSCKTKK